ncbi:MAG: YecA family protein, partial [Myxococcales bacterium]
MASGGPNAPCPCGSGLKQKKCHPESAAAPEANPKAVVRGFRELVSTVLDDLTEFANDHHEEWVQEAAQAFLGGEEAVDEDELVLMVPYALFHHARDGRTIAELYAQQKGASLPEPQRTFIEKQRSSHLSWWRIVKEDADGLFTLRDLFTGEEKQLHEPDLADSGQEGLVVLGSVIEWRGLSVLSAIDASALPHQVIEALLPGVAEDLKLTPGAVRPEQLKAPEVQEALIGNWRGAIEALAAHADGEEGDEALFDDDDEAYEDGEGEGEAAQSLVTDRFSFAAARREQVLAKLKEEPAFDFGEPHEGVDLALLRDPEDEESGFGQLSVGPDWLEIDTTDQHIDEARALVERACGALVTFESREADSIDDLVAELGDDDLDEGEEGEDDVEEGDDDK